VALQDGLRRTIAYFERLLSLGATPPGRAAIGGSGA
jgi:hypothetical protein